MSFLKRKRVKFTVDLQVCDLSDVPLVNAVLFAKVRLLDGGVFEDRTERVEVHSNSATWSRRFNFCCRIATDPQTGILEKCPCRISLRKEQKGGRSFAKLGYVDINLSEFAASGVEGVSRSYLLDGYGINQRQDNSRVTVKVTMVHHSSDPLFKLPRIAASSSIESARLNPVDRKAMSDEPSDGSGEGNTPTVAFRMPDANGAESGSVAGASGPDDSSSLASEPRGSQMTKGGYRRLSQDRTSAPRLQSTRIDAEDMIEKMIAETALNEEMSLDDDDGLALYVDRDGQAIISAPKGFRSRDYERVRLSES
ncbi:unnamed protein product, partial [Mesorhabditis spiculigera]